MDITAKIEQKRQKIIDQIIKAAKADSDETDALDYAIEKLEDLIRESAMASLVIDLRDAEEISDEGIEFAIANNGVPARVRRH